ncbi:hypothetical protein KUTeg_009377 [Tegillarca granosa]|uniref:Uncharacterized protein n=1 Tax=Tegillarca granosa TaxID=220873 RepID=A0ABQ9F3N4_TEGGR|nr:hypothetical protein KUTeg_009377 [Tegillarca granosa]
MYKINMEKEDGKHDTQNISHVETSLVNKFQSVSEESFADNEVENMTGSKSLSKTKSSIWVIVRDKMSLTKKGSTPLNWKVLSLLFLSFVCVFI